MVFKTSRFLFLRMDQYSVDNVFGNRHFIKRQSRYVWGCYFGRSERLETVSVSVLFATTPVLLNSFISNFNNFSIFYFLRPEITYDTANYFNANNTDLLINWMFNLTVDKKLYSLGSALSLILFVFMAIFSLIVYVSSPAYKKEDTYK